ncbi:hypothetical protein AB3X91_14795 [Paraburkholderia sp. BR14263]|uniref:hypothetical protein n=1 Tax=unclassified Paraburkholderia TaxID=2615204 RepID=UPI0034CE8A6F
MKERAESNLVEARIRQLENRRGDLWSAAGGAQFAANRCREYLDGRRQPSDLAVALAAIEGVDWVEHYRTRMASRLADAAIAKARAKAISAELRALRGASTDRRG